MNVIVFETFKHMSAPCLSKTTQYIYDMFMWLPLAQCKGYLCNKRRHKKVSIHKIDACVSILGTLFFLHNPREVGFGPQSSR